MSVRKRVWQGKSGEERTAWAVDYKDNGGKRRHKTFGKKKDADAFAAKASFEVREGTHVADSASVTVNQAGRLWLAGAANAGLERSTIEQYTQHLELHIAPFLGSTLLTKLQTPTARAFEDRLRQEGRSPAMVRKILVSLSSILADAQERGLTGRNVVREMRGKRRQGKELRAERRQKGKIKVGVDLPTPDEIRRILANLEGRWKPLLQTAIFTGLRVSELRGLRWSDVDFDKREIRVHQRADRFNQIGRPKSEAGERTVPVSSRLIATLREWKLACPKGSLGLVFPNGKGHVESLGNITNRGLKPAQVVAGVVADTGRVDNEGKPILEAKYGMHSLRHFYASWCINRPQEGGLGLPAKVVQERLGHSTIIMTMNTYSHLFPRGDDAEEFAAAERLLFA